MFCMLLDKTLVVVTVKVWVEFPGTVKFGGKPGVVATAYAVVPLGLKLVKPRSPETLGSISRGLPPGAGDAKTEVCVAVGDVTEKLPPKERKFTVTITSVSVPRLVLNLLRAMFAPFVPLTVEAKAELV